jgi:hypothetical protein
MAGPRTSTPRPIDPGWLFLAAGIGLAAATVLIPAAQQVAEARWERDRALVRERWSEQRLARFQHALEALEAGDPVLIERCRVAMGKAEALPPEQAILPAVTASGSPFHGFEPEYPPEPPRPEPPSLLARLAMGDRSRLVLIAVSAMCLLLGLLPQSTTARDDDDG